MATTMHWLPNLSDALFTNSWSATAAVFMETLSAPALKSSFISSRVLMPPPTVRGIDTSAAVFSTTSIMVFLSSWDAVMSRKTSSSAPCSSYALAHSTGSPASLSWTKLMPFTTRPSFTSRHGMMRLVSIGLERIG